MPTSETSYVHGTTRLTLLKGQQSIVGASHGLKILLSMHLNAFECIPRTSTNALRVIHPLALED